MIPDEVLLHLLKKHFGYEAFRPLQRDIMEAALAGRDTLAILPTGAPPGWKAMSAGSSRL